MRVGPPAPRTAEELRAEARRVRDLAQHISREDMRGSMLEIADLYEEAARRLEVSEAEKR